MKSPLDLQIANTRSIPWLKELMNKVVGKHRAKFSTFATMITNAYVMEGGAWRVSDKATGLLEKNTSSTKSPKYPTQYPSF
jgi:hypothetical protein